MLLGMRQGLTGSDPSPVINWDFLQSQSLTSFSRTSNATLFDSTGQLTYAANNLLLNSATLSTQTVTTGLQAGVSVILSFSGTGSVAISGGYTGSLAGTGVSDRVSLKFTTTTNSLTFTVTGSVTSAQLEVVTYQTTPSTYTATTSSQYYGPRYPYAYNGTTWDAQGLLVEAAATNVLSYTQAMDDSAWRKTRTTVNPNQSTAPDGTLTADLLQSDASNNTHFFDRDATVQAISITSGVAYTYSIFMKKGTGSTAPNIIQIALSGGAFPSGYANFNISTGTVLTTSNVNASIVNVGSGWYRCIISNTANATSSATGAAFIAFTNNDDALGRLPSYIDASTSDIFIWGAQFEQGDLPTSYIPNLSTGTTTRNADTSLAFSAISLPTGLSFSRASNAMQYDAAGRLTYAPNNLCIQSNSFTTTWTTSSAMVPATTTAVNDPLGGTSAWTFTEDTSSGYHREYQVLTLATGQSYVVSVYLQNIDARYFNFSLYSGPTDYAAAIFDLVSLAATTGASGTGYSVSDGNVVSVGSGWYRCSFKITLGSASVTVSIGLSNSATISSYGLSATYTGTSRKLYVFGAQIETVTYETLPRPYNATTTDPKYGPRYDYDPLTRLPKGLLIEEGRTNSAVQSNSFNTTWQKGTTPTFSQNVVGVDGATSGWTYTADTANDNSNVVYQTSSLASGNTISIYAKAGTNNFVFLQQNDASGVRVTWFNLLTGVAATTNKSYASPTITQSNPTITPVGNGWYRCSITSSGAALQYVGFGQADADNSRATTSGRTIFVQNFQAEAGSFPTSYIPNPGIASGIRSADLPDSTNATVIGCKTFLVETSGMQAATTATILGLNAGIGLGATTGNTLTTAFGGTQTTTATATWTGTVRSGIAWGASKVSITFNGNAVTTAANATSALTTTSFGHTNNSGTRGAFMNGWMRKVAGYSSALSDASLATKSTVGANF